MMVASAGFGQGKRAIMPPRQRINFYEYAVSLGIGRLHQRNVLAQEMAAKFDGKCQMSRLEMLYNSEPSMVYCDGILFWIMREAS
ncbi:hypothetical protein AiwAL_16990 [Acidiphilium sp. AL]|nr:hypothetical protein [Acidiphilium sp. AL]MCU4161777.1 hypothetical protein [Acidiphilium sp. AL]